MTEKIQMKDSQKIVSAENQTKALEAFGEEVVIQVSNLVSFSSPESAYAQYLRFKQDTHARCVEMMYFDNTQNLQDA